MNVISAYLSEPERLVKFAFFHLIYKFTVRKSDLVETFYTLMFQFSLIPFPSIKFLFISQESQYNVSHASTMYKQRCLPVSVTHIRRFAGVKK